MTEEQLPPGYAAVPAAPTRKQMIQFYATTYGLAVVGVLLLPIALWVRASRWSVRTLVANHLGWEFPNW